jgi:quinohemoprotein ethanol dehydrogenase
MAKRCRRNAAAASIAALSIACTGVAAAADATHQPANVDGARIAAADHEPDQWLSHGRTYNEQRFSPLDQIDRQSVKRLGLAWFADFDTVRNQESTPIVVDGVVYVSTAWSKVYAFDGRTGRTLWKYDPQVSGAFGYRSCCDVVNRGVAAWQGKIYVGTIDGRLIAIDAKTGKQAWQTDTSEGDGQYSITGAPRVANGKVLIGNSGADIGVRGYISAYDAQTGKRAWRFYTVPGNPAKGFENDAMRTAAKTWSGQWWALGGGGSVWDGITYDPQTDLVYFGVANGSPWNPEVRTRNQGDNLFLTSIVAVKAQTGEYAWHYQEVQRDSWDYDAVQQITVADLSIDGRTRHVVMQAAKDGYFYVLDAQSGKVVLAKNFVPVTWAKKIDPQTGRAEVNPAARFELTGKTTLVAPFGGGGHSWSPDSYSPQTGLMYFSALDSYGTYTLVKDFKPGPVGLNLGVDMSPRGVPAVTRPGPAKASSEGLLMAWDPVQQRERWRVSFGLKARGGGTLATAGGLVFQGNTQFQEFAAYDAATGGKLWSMPAQTGILAGPISYAVDRVQYVAVTAGINQTNYYDGNHSRLLVYQLGGAAALPPALASPLRPFDPPPATASPAVVASGDALYERLCSVCHGQNGVSAGNFPDLRRSGALKAPELFKQIVRKGALQANGMVSFAKVLGPSDAESIRAFLVDRSNAALAAQRASGGAGSSAGR